VTNVLYCTDSPLGHLLPCQMIQESNAMLTFAECRALAEAKLAQAEHDERHRRRLISAAEGWLLLASQMRRLEASLGDDGKMPE
jgi:hypothetical protein